MKTRNWKIGMLMMVAAVLLTAQVASAGYTVRVFDSDFQWGLGGEFWAAPSQDLAALVNYSGGGYDPAMLNTTYEPDAFATFCVETNETFGWGTTYYVQLNDKIVRNAGQSGFPKALPQGVAALYYLFATKQLDDIGLYDYTATPNNLRDDAAGKLQDAIWYLLGEGGVNNNVAQYVTTNWGSWYSKDNYDSISGTRAYPVMVMNMWQNPQYTGYTQDMLVLVSEPGILLLLGTGMLGLALVGRKTRRQRA